MEANSGKAAKGARAARKAVREERPPILSRTLYYLTSSIPQRAASTSTPTLEALIRRLTQETMSCNDRMHSPAGDTVTRIWMNRWIPRSPGFSGIVVHTGDGQHRRRYETQFDQPSVTMSAEPAGVGKEWENGSIFFYVRGNDIVVLQGATVRVPTLQSYFTNVLRNHAILSGTESILLQAPIATDVLKHLKKVQSISIYQIQEPKEKTKKKSVELDPAVDNALSVTPENPLQKIRQGLGDLVQQQLDRFASASALAPNSLRYELNISIDRRAMQLGSESLKQIARTLLMASGGDPTNMEMSIVSASNKIRRNVVSQRTVVDIERDGAMLPDLQSFHDAAERWLTELDSINAEEAV